MAALAGGLATLGRSQLKLLPCVGRLVIADGLLTAMELIHRMSLNSVFFRELSTIRPVYPGVEWLCFDASGAFAHVE